ncbi:MAG TPA: DUF1524 domain-containing protein, partial [Phaeodactylibacter sp.]|nr:DUF1524 domain-containing protein [Phaeodactylibacter sp.]
LNIDAGTLYYEQKKDFYLKSNSKLTKEIPNNYQTWTEENIINRQKKLAKAAKSIWTIQELS